ncbi:MAG: hypothetical protein AAF564_25120, partial [Bacteroidota bacterium]
MLWKSGKAQAAFKRMSWLPLVCLFAIASLVLSFRSLMPGLEAPAAIGPFLNGKLPPQLATDMEVVSTEDFI